MMRNTEKKMNEAAALRRLESLCARSEHSEGELRDGDSQMRRKTA